MIDPLLLHREKFPILETTNYLISNSLGAVPSAVAQNLASYYETWAARGVRAWEETWWTMAVDLGDLVAPLLGAEGGQIAFQPNVTIAHAVVLSAVDFSSERRRIVSDAMHFPSILYLLGGMVREGAEVVVIPTEDGISIDAGRLIEAIDEQTACVVVSHVLFRSSYIQDIASIAARARSVGALTIVDGYQAVGSIEIDVRALGVDVYLGGCLKWLCGGPGAAFVWVDPDVSARLAPKLTGWMADSQPFGFRRDLRRRGDVWRFLHGTPNIPAFYAARPGLEIVNEAGASAIRSKSIRQTARLIDLAREAGYSCRVPEQAAHRAGTVAIDLDHGLEISRALKAREILCDYRPNAGLRLSPHFYTSDDEIHEAVAAIVEIVERKSWEGFGGHHSEVT